MRPSVTLTSGTRLGTYEIVAPLGEGGMGAVYRARDTKLGRAVAIKVILDQFAANEERVGRFEREAKMLAALHHHRIASLFGLEHADGRHFLVMELVEGETLAERLRRGALPVEDALALAIQIAEALEAAHEKGVVHRDLKPANVKITPDGHVKVLDFGLAKAIENESTAGSAANSPTLSMAASQAGLILGTAAYMSPEQAKGFPADHRSDIFSFGVVLAEMLSGRQPFRGDTAPEILASVLVREPDTSTIPADLNPRLLEIIQRCLAKNPRKRWQAIGDVRAELEALAAAPRATAVTTAAIAPPKPLWRRAVSFAIVGAAATAIGAALAWSLKPAPTLQVSRFSIALPPDHLFTGAARQMVDVSPAGDRIAYVANNYLYVRHISEHQAVRVPGTLSIPVAATPTFSPDGQTIAFWVPGEQAIKTVPVAGGTPLTLGHIEFPYGMSWTGDRILVGQGHSGILRMSGDASGAETVVKLGQGENAYGPQLLPDGDHVLFTVGFGKGAERWTRAAIVVQSLRSGERKTLISAGSDARYLPSGHLAYMIGGIVFAVRFDPERLKTVGTAVPILDGVLRAPVGATAASQFAFSRNGLLAYIPGPTTGAADRHDLTLANRRGESSPLKLPPGPYESPRVSPDGKRIVFGSEDASGSFILVHDLYGKTAPRRITFKGRNRLPIWTADGNRILFQSDRDGDLALFWQTVDGSAEAERLTKPDSGEEHIPDDCSGETCLFTVLNRSTYTLRSLSLRDRKTAPIVAAASTVPSGARFSRDGRWIAYGMRGASTATIVVEPFPPTGARLQLLQKPGDAPHHPLWSPDGKELFYNPRPHGFEAVPVTTVPSLGFGVPSDFPRNFRTDAAVMRASYDIMPDGRILGLVNPLEQGGGDAAREIRIVLNWFEELKGKLPK